MNKANGGIFSFNKSEIDEEARDSFFGLLLREISVIHSTLELPKLFALSTQFKNWIYENFSEINRDMNVDEGNSTFENSTSDSIQPGLIVKLQRSTITPHKWPSITFYK